MTQEIRLPKCLTQEEQEKMRDYIYSAARRLDYFSGEPIYDIKSIFSLHKINMRGGLCFEPFAELFPCCFSSIVGSLNHALRKTLKDVLTKSFSKWKGGDIIFISSRAYAMAIHSLNYPEPEGDYGMFSELWKDEKLIKRIKGALPFKMSLTDYDKTQCELICACMVYCILEYENEPNTEQLLQLIRQRLENSESGINLETLETFRQAVAESIEAETKTPTDKQNTATTQQQPLTSQSGRSKNYLFEESKTKKLAAEFLRVLSDKNLSGNPDSEERKKIYKALLEFIQSNEVSVKCKSGASLCRFLTESCGILLPQTKGGKKVNNSNFENEIRALLYERKRNKGTAL